MPKLKKPPVVTNLAPEDVILTQSLIRDTKTKQVTGLGAFDRFAPADGVGIVQLTTSVANYGKNLSEIDMKDIKFRRLVVNR